MDLKKVVKLYVPLQILVAVLFVVGYMVLEPTVSFVLTTVAIVAFCIWFRRVWRCPDCGTSLGSMVFTVEITCPHCGKKHRLK